MPPGITIAFVCMTSKTSPEPKTCRDVVCKSPDPVMRSTMQTKTEQQRKHIRWSHAKQFCGYFPSLQIPVCFRGVTGKIKEITFPTVCVIFLFFPFRSHWEIQLSISQWDSRQDLPPEIFPSVPQGTWEKVGISLCWQHCLSMFSLHTSCQRVSEWDCPPHGVTNRNTKHKLKNTVKMDDRVGDPIMVWRLNCQIKG